MQRRSSPRKVCLTSLIEYVTYVTLTFEIDDGLFVVKSISVSVVSVMRVLFKTIDLDDCFQLFAVALYEVISIEVTKEYDFFMFLL